LINSAPAAAEVVAQFLQAVLPRQGSCAYAGRGRLKHKPLLAVQPLSLLHGVAAFLWQLVALLHVEVLVINAAVKVERDAAYIEVVTSFVEITESLAGVQPFVYPSGVLDAPIIDLDIIAWRVNIAPR
jgi:hypothetical protein